MCIVHIYYVSMYMICVPDFTHAPLQWFIDYLLPTKTHEVAYLCQLYYCTSYLNYMYVWLLSSKFACCGVVMYFNKLEWWWGGLQSYSVSINFMKIGHMKYTPCFVFSRKESRLKYWLCSIRLAVTSSRFILCAVTKYIFSDMRLL